MKCVSLRRFASSDQGTFGRIRCNGLVLFTLELPWRNNARNISCIPTGFYIVRWTFSPRYQRFMYLIGDVPDRDGCRMHSANYAGDPAKGYHSQLNGCVALGEKYGIMGGQKAIMVSRPAIRRFEDHMERKSFELEVIDP